MRTVEIITNIVLVLLIISHVTTLVDSVQAIVGAKRLTDSLMVVPPTSPSRQNKAGHVSSILVNVLIILTLVWLLFRRSMFRGTPSHMLTTAIMAMMMIAHLAIGIFISYGTSYEWEQMYSDQKAFSVGMSVYFLGMAVAFLYLVIGRSRR